jgi:hypothetical protein
MRRDSCRNLRRLRLREIDESQTTSASKTKTKKPTDKSYPSMSRRLRRVRAGGLH